MFTFAAFCYMLSLVLCVSLIFFAIWHVSTSECVYVCLKICWWIQSLLLIAHQVWHVCVTLPGKPHNPLSSSSAYVCVRVFCRSHTGRIIVWQMFPSMTQRQVHTCIFCSSEHSSSPTLSSYLTVLCWPNLQHTERLATLHSILDQLNGLPSTSIRDIIVVKALALPPTPLPSYPLTLINHTAQRYTPALNVTNRVIIFE